MSRHSVSALAANVLAGLFLLPTTGLAANAKETAAQWPERPRLAAAQMLVKYGEPELVNDEKLVWMNKDRYLRIVVTKQEIPHDFPTPHMDYLAHTIEYRVPSAKADELVAFDGSVIVDRTAGEMTARCDLEGHNILTLNIAHDIVTGKKDVAAGRKAFGEIVVEDVMGKNPPYVMALQFEKSSTASADADVPVIPGSPVRAPKKKGEIARQSGNAAMTDAEVLAFITAVDNNEVLAAAEAEKKTVSPEVLAYAKMLHKAHGKSLGDTMKLGMTVGATPMITDAVDAVRVKGAGALAPLVPLEGKEFEIAYLDVMVKDHTEVLAMIDGQLMPAAKKDAVKKHLAATRGHVAMHLEEAKKLQGMKR